MRDPIDVLRALLLCGAAGFAIAGDLDGALLLGGAGLVAWLVRPVLLPRMYDLALVPALTLQAWGEALGLYDSIGWFDNVEWSSDNTAGSSLQLGNDDTVGDLIADSLGSLGGAALLVCWARWGWGSVRRIPGESRFEAPE